MRATIVATLRLNLTLVFDFGDSSDFGFKASSSFSLTRLSISLPRAVVPFVKPGGPADKRKSLLRISSGQSMFGTSNFGTE